MTATTRTQSDHWVAQAEQHLPGGVNSPVRAFRAVGGKPIIFEKAHGSRLIDVDGNEYVDFVGSWGPMILGHAHPAVVQAVQHAAANGLSFGATSPYEVRLAEAIKRFFPTIELVRLVNSGTECTMSALRVARGFTGRPGIVKFEGCYHGHSDCLLAKAGSGAMTLALPDSAGVPASVAQHTYTLPFNDLPAARSFFRQKGAEMAAIIVEPVAGNMGVVPPQAGYLAGLRELCDEHGALLIFDEVMTGFRLTRGGAQELYGIRPDLTCLGKIVGGGLPLAAYGGRHDVMEQVAPLGPVYQAGTLSGNPLASAAGLATLETLESQEDLYSDLESLARTIEERLNQESSKRSWPLQVQRVGSMFTVFFADRPVVDYTSARTCNTARYSIYFRHLLEAGYYLPPSQFEALFLGHSHTRQEIDNFIKEALKAMEMVFSST